LKPTEQAPDAYQVPRQASGELQVSDHLAIIAAVEDQVERLQVRAEITSVFNPFVILTLFPISREKREMLAKYEEGIIHAEAIADAPFQTVGMLVGGIMARRTGQSISKIIRLQSAWNDLGAILDRKYAYSLAIISLYISVISLALSVVSLFM